ncbi:MAG: adenosylcobinamide amidohydrolase, partial [Thermodesulfobacteriota bacterium]
MKIFNLLSSLFIALLLFHPPCPAGEITFTDDGGKKVTIRKVPERVVSLVPSATEIIFALGAGEAVKGITCHSAHLENAWKKKVVGGYVQPSTEAVQALEPDLVFVSGMHRGLRDTLCENQVPTVQIGIDSVPQSLGTIELLGRIFDREKQAAQMTASIREKMDLIERKIRSIAPEDRKRVMRLMGREKLMTPGDDSFQNGMIRLAGGIPPQTGKTGDVVRMTKQEWIDFNPRVVYGCGGDKKLWNRIRKKNGWKQVDAVQNNRFFSFPCDLTCRAATRTGDFVQRLSAAVYADRFGTEPYRVFKDGVISTRPLTVDLDFVKDARIDESRILDFTNRTLVMEFKTPTTILSTLEGWKTDVTSAGNHYTPPQNWLIDHKQGLPALRKRVMNALGLESDGTALLFTGADMNNLAVRQERFRDLKVWAFVTAGVESNAMRAGKDKGLFYEPGTINVILLSNMHLSKRAMTRALIAATEAKTAALMDLDIRTGYGNGEYRATGTGTDNVLVIQGTGETLDKAGGHTRLGEMIAKAVSGGVKEAILKQNGLTAERDVFSRLKKRGISIYGLMKAEQCDCGRTKSEFAGAVEHILLKNRYRGFIETAFAVNDDYEKGLIKDLSTFEAYARKVAEEIAGQEIDS